MSGASRSDLAAPAVSGGEPERLAAIDVGSNSIRLVVADYDPVAGLTIVDEVKEQPRLAAGIAATGRLDPAAVERALQALRRMREVCERRGVRRIAAVATAAVRDAANGEEFARRVREELELPIRVIDAGTEAALSYRSVAHHFALERGRTVVADIGGGSLELIGAVDGVVELTLSLPFGAVRLTELHLHGVEGDARPAVAGLRARLRRQFRRRLPLRDWAAATVIGSGGTFTSLGRMVLARRGGGRIEQVHGTRVAAAEVTHLLEWLATLPPERRRQVPGLNPQRADIIVAGLAVTAELLERVEAREVTVSAFGLREGILLEMVAGDGGAPTRDPLRLARELGERCRVDRLHAERTRELALQLFAQLGPALGASPEERHLLEMASLLHDVGQLVSYRRHHKHSYQIVLHADRLNLGARDRTLVALLCRYHTGKPPRRKHEEFAALDAADQAVVRRLAALLRVAVGLDRGHTGAVDDVRVELDPARATLHLRPREPGADLSLEIWGGQEKADLLAKLLGREVVIVPAPGTTGPQPAARA
ncbi:MAG TPA: Ppx/GppA phosphatase family protein [Gemmatimonadales bacterium]|nr:Ppx/GppA phosphatase family protein [Gemmatimonadales bacterium]